MHVDMDAFFASVEQRDHPEWKWQPVIVGGGSKRGVVATASYEARAFGVHSAMPGTQARRLCPQGIFVAPRIEAYQEVSARIHEVMTRYAADIEPRSLDEAFLDISDMGKYFRSLDEIGRAIKKDIYEATELTASAGIGPNKFLAKMASDMDKPDGLTIIPYGKEEEILAPLPVRRLWGVGQVTERRLLAAGFHSIGDIQKVPLARLQEVVGDQAQTLQALSRGIDNRPVVTHRTIQSIGDESTYEEDLRDRGDIERQLAIHSDIVARRLRKQGLEARTVTLKIRFSSFRTVTRSQSFETGTDLQEEILATAKDLLSRVSLREGIRLLGVTASNLCPAMEHMALFSDKREKQAKATAVMDAIQERYGETGLRKGFWLEEERIRKEKKKKKEKDEYDGQSRTNE